MFLASEYLEGCSGFPKDGGGYPDKNDDSVFWLPEDYVIFLLTRWLLRDSCG